MCPDIPCDIGEVDPWRWLPRSEKVSPLVVQARRSGRGCVARRAGSPSAPRSRGRARALRAPRRFVLRVRARWRGPRAWTPATRRLSVLVSAVVTAVRASVSACSSSPRWASRSASAAAAITRTPEPGGGTARASSRSRSASSKRPRWQSSRARRALAVAAAMAYWAMSSSSSALYRHARSRSPSIVAISREVHVGVPGRVAGHLAQVARARLGERPRLVEAAEHREEHRPRQVLGAGRTRGGELVDQLASPRRPAAGRRSARNSRSVSDRE